jgi:osmotically-inducible protein OsmY
LLLEHSPKTHDGGRTGQRLGVPELAQRRLNDRALVALRNVACDFHDGVLTLRGCLPTYYLKQLAQACVADLTGVRRVVNDIEVAAPRGQRPWHELARTFPRP